MKKELIQYLLVILISVGIITGLFDFLAERDTSPDITTNVSAKTIKVEIDFGNSRLEKMEIPMKENLTVFSALEFITAEKNIPLETIPYSFGIFVKKIGDLESNMETAWIYSVNGESGQIAADQYILKGNDFVLWKYTEAKY